MTTELARDVLEVFAVAFGVGLAAISSVISARERIRSDYQAQLDSAFSEIRQLKAQLAAVTRLLEARGLGGLQLQTDGDVIVGGDLSGSKNG